MEAGGGTWVFSPERTYGVVCPLMYDAKVLPAETPEVCASGCRVGVEVVECLIPAVPVMSASSICVIQELLENLTQGQLPWMARREWKDVPGYVQEISSPSSSPADRGTSTYSSISHPDAPRAFGACP